MIRDWVAPYCKGGVTEGFADLPHEGLYFLQITDGHNDARAIAHAVLKTEFRSTDDPLEPNNSFGKAAPLPFGKPHTGYNILPRATMTGIWSTSTRCPRSWTSNSGFGTQRPRLNTGIRRPGPADRWLPTFQSMRRVTTGSRFPMVTMTPD